MVGQSLARDVLGELLYHCGILLHGNDGTRDQFPVLPRREVPRANPHQVIKGEFQYETAFCDHLGREYATEQLVSGQL